MRDVNGDWLMASFDIIWLLGFTGRVGIIETSRRIIFMLGDDAIDEHGNNDYRKCAPK